MEEKTITRHLPVRQTKGGAMRQVTTGLRRAVGQATQAFFTVHDLQVKEVSEASDLPSSSVSLFKTGRRMPGLANLSSIIAGFAALTGKPVSFTITVAPNGLIKVKFSGSAEIDYQPENQ